jgi:hypothetical protein
LFLKPQIRNYYINHADTVGCIENYSEHRSNHSRQKMFPQPNTPTAFRMTVSTYEKYIIGDLSRWAHTQHMWSCYNLCMFSRIIFDANDYIFQQAVTCNKIQTRFRLNPSIKKFCNTKNHDWYLVSSTQLFVQSLGTNRAGSYPAFQRSIFGSESAQSDGNCLDFLQQC